MEKIEPIIDNPAPLNSCFKVFTNPSLRSDTESNTDLIRRLTKMLLKLWLKLKSQILQDKEEL